MSKGSKQRPGTGYADNWDRIFGKKAKSEQALKELTDLSQEMGLCDKPTRITGNFRCKVNGLDTLNDAGFEIVTQPGFDYVLEAIGQPAKTCQHCKHYGVIKYNPLRCENPIVKDMLDHDNWDSLARMEPPADFGCLRWEGKV